MDLVHMGRFGSVRTLHRCVDMPFLLWVPWWQSFIPYLMEVLWGFPLSLRLFLKHLVIGLALKRLYVSLCEFQCKRYLITPDFWAVCRINILARRWRPRLIPPTQFVVTGGQHRQPGWSNFSHGGLQPRLSEINVCTRCCGSYCLAFYL